MWMEERWRKYPRDRENPFQKIRLKRNLRVLDRANELGVIQKFLEEGAEKGWIGFDFPQVDQKLEQMAGVDRGRAFKAADEPELMRSGVPLSLRYDTAATVVDCPFPLRGRDRIRFDDIKPFDRPWDYFQTVRPYLKVIPKFRQEYETHVAWCEQEMARKAEEHANRVTASQGVLA